MAESNEWDLPKPGQRNRLIVSVLVVFIILLSSVIVYQTFAGPAPGRSAVITPGTGAPCDLRMYLDTGQVGVANCHTGDNYGFQANGDFGNAFNNIAVPNCPAAGCHIYIESGIYTEVHSSNMASNMRIEGAGIGATTIVAASNYVQGCVGEGGLFENPSCSNTGIQNVTITNLSINGNEANRGALVANDYGIDFNGAANSLNKNIIIDHVNVFAVFGTCISGRYVQNWVISHFFVRGCSQAGQGGIYHGIYFLRSSNGAIMGGVSSGMLDGSGIKVGLGSNDVLVTGVDSTLNAKDGFELSGGLGVDRVTAINFVGDDATNNTLNGFDFNIGAIGGLSGVLLQSDVSEFNVQNGVIANNVKNLRIGESVIMDNAKGVTGWQGLRLVSDDYDVVVVGNRIGDDQTTPSQASAIQAQGTRNVTISSNDLTRNIASPVYQDGGNNTLIVLSANLGYNQLGKVTNFVVPGLRFAPWGSASAVVASTTYTVSGVNIFNFTSTGGTGVSILIQDSGGNTLVSGATTVTNIRLLVGDTVSFGAFSVAPTVKAYFE